ncbi:MAG TPA: hypothetical protein VFF27_11320 [Bacteroidia bacterium]|jgi:hypothetical protein|nr:hypothetical protein [Bacteroidia bacterium]
MKSGFLVILLSLAFFTVKGQADSTRIANSAIEIVKLDSLPEQLYQYLSSYKLIMVGEMHGTAEPAGFVKGLAELFTRHKDSVLVGFEISVNEMKEFLKKRTERSVFNSDFFVEPCTDGRASEAWAGCISYVTMNRYARIFFYDINSTESKTNQERDSLMYVNIKNEMKKHPSSKVITLSGNMHNMLLPYKGEKKVAGFLNADKELNLEGKICSINHVYKSGTMLNNMGKGLKLNKVNNGDTGYSKFTKYNNYFFPFQNSKQYAYSGAFFTRNVTASKLISAGPAKDELNETFKEDDVSATEHLKEKLKPIQANFKRINSISNWDTIYKRAMLPAEKLRFYYNGKTLEKITVRDGQGKDQSLTEYYLWKGQLSMMYKKYFDKTEVDEAGKPEIVLEKYYFEKGKLLHLVSNFDCGAPFADDHLLEEQVRINKKFEEVMKLK